MGLLLQIALATAVFVVPLFWLLRRFGGRWAIGVVTLLLPAGLWLQGDLRCGSGPGPFDSPGDGIMWLFWTPVLVVWFVVALVAFSRKAQGKHGGKHRVGG